MYSRKKAKIYGLIINYGLNMIILNKLATSNFIPKHNENTALTHIHEGLQKCFRLRDTTCPSLMKELNAEHETVRTAVGVLMSHMGEFYLQVLMHWL
jgi:hypothetical protein